MAEFGLTALNTVLYFLSDGLQQKISCRSEICKCSVKTALEPRKCMHDIPSAVSYIDMAGLTQRICAFQPAEMQMIPSMQKHCNSILT